MTRDPLYLQVVGALDRELDEDLFERCAADLLRDAYPALAPVIGGNDAGYDGAIGTDNGAFPLLTTVAKRGPLGNLRKNLATYIRGRGPRLAVVATPRKVSNAKRRRLEQVAIDEFGVRLVNLHEQGYFASRLYRDDRWRLELLGLAGRPEALSVLPARSRPDRPTLIGRDEDLKWLRAAPGDLLIIGQPGIGKTYLHQALALEGKALFAVDEDSERLANALRAREPEVVVIDDAQDSLNLVRTLRRLREELGFGFVIHANCWEHGEGPVRAELEVPDAGVRRLGLLTRQQILDVVRELGVFGPDRLLHLLLDQAEGKPGLASAMVAAAKRGDLHRVWSGEALAESLLHGRQLLRHEHDLPVLASFALGGDAGASSSEVASALGITPMEVRSTVLSLAAGGVVEEVGTYIDPRLAIRPDAIRGVLVRDAFYRGAGRLDPAPVIQRLRSDQKRVEGLATTLLAARQRGASISDALLLAVVAQADSNRVWRHLGYVGGSLADALVQQHPEKVPLAADGLLRINAAAILPRLLTIASAPKSHDGTEARRAVTDWLEGDDPGDDESIPRRAQLLVALKRTSDVDAVGHAIDGNHWALAAAMTPEVDTHRVRPGDGRSVTIYRGLRSLRQLQQIADLWPDVLALMRHVSTLSPELRGAIEDWCFPGRHAGRGSEDAVDFARHTGTRMLTDVQHLDACRRVCISWIKQTASRASLHVRTRPDRMFQRVFESRDWSTNWQTNQARRATLLKGVADELTAAGPTEAIRTLGSMEREAADFEWHDGHDRHTLYERLAQSATADAEAWLRAALAERLPPVYLYPFLTAAVRQNVSSLRDLLEEMLRSDEYSPYRQMASLAVISQPDPDSYLLSLALGAVADQGHATAFAFQHAKPPVGTTLRLLEHTQVTIRVYAALAEWNRDRTSRVREPLLSAWRSAVLDASDEYEYLLQQVLEADETLAFEWVQRKIDEANQREVAKYHLWKLDDLFSAATSKLDREKRWALLAIIQSSSYVDQLLEVLMAGDPELFRRWLRRHLQDGESGHYLALRPLNRQVDDTWERFAIVAADEGVEPTELAKHSINHSRDVITGPFSAFFFRMIPVYERLANHADERLHEAGARGLEWARGSFQREHEQETLEAIRGI